MNSSAYGNLRYGTCVSIFRGNKEKYIDSFSLYFGISNVLKSEFLDITSVMEFVVVRSCISLWFESDSKLVIVSIIYLCKCLNSLASFSVDLK